MSERASDRISFLRYENETFSSFSSHSSEDLFVIMDSEKLIELVKAHTGLYDLSSPNYSDSTWKEKVWKEIADELHLTGKILINLFEYNIIHILQILQILSFKEKQIT